MEVLLTRVLVQILKLHPYSCVPKIAKGERARKNREQETEIHELDHKVLSSRRNRCYSLYQDPEDSMTKPGQFPRLIWNILGKSQDPNILFVGEQGQGGT